ncbi:MAG: hypothetical protein ACJ72N_24625 [Labedaea sp.]
MKWTVANIPDDGATVTEGVGSASRAAAAGLELGVAAGATGASPDGAAVVLVGAGVGGAVVVLVGTEIDGAVVVPVGTEVGGAVVVLVGTEVDGAVVVLVGTEAEAGGEVPGCSAAVGDVSVPLGATVRDAAAGTVAGWLDGAASVSFGDGAPVVVGTGGAEPGGESAKAGAVSGASSAPITHQAHTHDPTWNSLRGRCGRVSWLSSGGNAMSTASREKSRAVMEAPAHSGRILVPR